MARKATPKKRQTSASQSSLRDYKPVKKATVRKGKVRAKPKQYPQRKVPGTDKQIDRSIRAKPVGWRISDKTGRRYFEDRENRSDTDKERRYHGGVNRRAEPAKRTAKASTRTTRSTTTSRRVSQVGKRDTQKGRRVKIVISRPKTRKGQIESWCDTFKFYEQKKKKVLTAAELEKIVIEEMTKIHLKKIEHCVVIDRCGNIICRGTGGESAVPRPDQAYKHLYGGSIEDFTRRYGTDLIHIHNHPGHSWEGAPTPFSPGDIAVTRILGIKDSRICCRGHTFRLVIQDRDRFERYTPMWYNSTIDTGLDKAIEKAWVDSPAMPEQRPGDTVHTYVMRVEKWKKDRKFLAAEYMDAYHKKELKKYGLKYSHSIFTEKGLIKND